jgi:DNA-binding NarL/FixJ family response regulator
MRDEWRDSGEQPTYLTFKVEGRNTILIEGALPHEAMDRLTPAEREVALLAAEGLSDRDIAARRSRSDRTVARQLSSVYRKLQIGSRTELAGLLSRYLGDSQTGE